jgi:hypothetical protein
MFSERWCDRARELWTPLGPPAVALTGRIQFGGPDDGARWGIAIDRGRVVAVVAGELPDPQIEVRMAEADLRAVVRRRLGGSAALARARVVHEGRVGDPPPLDLGEMRAIADLPELPGATLGVQYTLTNGPFGTVDHWIGFVDGRVAEMALERRPGADVRVTIPYAAMALVRLGRMTVPEALEFGDVTGAIGPMGALLGITESPEYQAAQAATGASAVPLAAYGEVQATTGFGAALDALLSETEPD